MFCHLLFYSAWGAREGCKLRIFITTLHHILLWW